MNNAKRIDPHEGAKLESSRTKKSKADTKTPKDKHVLSTKKPTKNGTPTSKDDVTKTHKKRKANNQKKHKIGGSEHEVELHTDVQSKAPQRKMQVKQRSFSTLLDTGSSQVAASDTVGSATVDETGVIAKGSYDLLFETRQAEYLCLSLGLLKRHVQSMLRAFKREEQLGTGDITTGEFFSMIHEQPRQLTKGLFQAVGLARDLRRMRFDDFVVSVATIATWSKSELLHYAFTQFDVDESGVMDGRELRAFCDGLKNDSSFYFSKNVNTAREKLGARDQNPYRYKETPGQRGDDVEDNILVDLDDLAKGSSEFQVAFYPLIQLQQNVRACALGERFWAEVAQRRHDIETIVQYMRLHEGQLPSFSILDHIVACMLPFSRANATLVVHKLAILKFAEEQRILQDQAHARAEADTILTGIQEEGHTQ